MDQPCCSCLLNHIVIGLSESETQWSQLIQTSVCRLFTPRKYSNMWHFCRLITEIMHQRRWRVEAGRSPGQTSHPGKVSITEWILKHEPGSRQTGWIWSSWWLLVRLSVAACIIFQATYSEAIIHIINWHGTNVFKHMLLWRVPWKWVCLDLHSTHLNRDYSHKPDTIKLWGLFRGIVLAGWGCYFIRENLFSHLCCFQLNYFGGLERGKGIAYLNGSEGFMLFFIRFV